MEDLEIWISKLFVSWSRVLKLIVLSFDIYYFKYRYQQHLGFGKSDGYMNIIGKNGSRNIKTMDEYMERRKIYGS